MLLYLLEPMEYEEHFLVKKYQNQLWSLPECRRIISIFMFFSQLYTSTIEDKNLWNNQSLQPPVKLLVAECFQILRKADQYWYSCSTTTADKKTKSQGWAWERDRDLVTILQLGKKTMNNTTKHNLENFPYSKVDRQHEQMWLSSCFSDE